MPGFDVAPPDGRRRRCQVPESDVTIGRDRANDLSLPDTNVSRFHAAIIVRDTGEFVLRDLGSRNGTLVNGAPVHRHVLQPGDEILIGSHGIVFLGPDGDPATLSSIGTMPATRRRGAALESPTATDPAGCLRRVESPIDGLGSTGLSLGNERLLEVLKGAQVIAASRDLSLSAARLLECVISFLRGQRGFILLRDGDSLRLETERSDGSSRASALAMDATAVYEALEGRAVVISSGKAANGKDLICIPLLLGETAVGVVGAEGGFPLGAEVPGLDLAAALCGLCAAHIENAREHSRLQRQCSKLHRAAQVGRRFVGRDPILREVCERIRQAAESEYPVLITGETGTGKDLVARSIHECSARRDGPFIACNCAAIPENLLESELFGYAPHSGIANANPRGKPGRFELAHSGTIFLDEIGDFTSNTQAKLLRVLEDCLVERIGAAEPVKVDVRIMTATNKDVRRMVDRSEFRADLYHRINCLQISLPPLRERASDVLLLAAYFLEQHAPAPIRESVRITNETARLLLSYRWPGNVRELRNAILAATTRITGSRLDPQHFEREIADFVGAARALKPLRQVEKEHIRLVLNAVGGNKRKAADILDVSPQTLYKKLSDYGIEREEITRDP